MTDQITGVVDNGGQAVADFPFYKGSVGIRTRPGSDVIEVAYRGDVPIARLPTVGRLNDEAVEILTLVRSATARNLMLATIRLTK